MSNLSWISTDSEQAEKKSSTLAYLSRDIRIEPCDLTLTCRGVAEDLEASIVYVRSKNTAEVLREGVERLSDFISQVNQRLQEADQEAKQRIWESMD